MSQLRKMPFDINKDTTVAGIGIWQALIVGVVAVVLVIGSLIGGITPPKIMKAILIVGGLYLMFLFDGFSKTSIFVDYMKSSKKETAESLSAFEEIETISRNKKIKTVITEITPEANFGALDSDYQEQLANEFAASTYEMTTRDATVRYISYSSSEPLYPLNRKLENLKNLDVHERVRHNYEKRISLHGLIADKAVKSNYFMRVDLPVKSETEWEDVLPFGEVVGSELIKEIQVHQLLPIPKTKRGETV